MDDTTLNDENTYKVLDADIFKLMLLMIIFTISSIRGDETIIAYEVRPTDVVWSNTPENELASVPFFLARLLKGLFCCTARL